MRMKNEEELNFDEKGRCKTSSSSYTLMKKKVTTKIILFLLVSSFTKLLLLSSPATVGGVKTTMAIKGQIIIMTS